jgi:hypothetical protein
MSTYKYQVHLYISTMNYPPKKLRIIPFTIALKNKKRPYWSSLCYKSACVIDKILRKKFEQAGEKSVLCKL